jgi:ketosteroid isomerase-like protein
MKKLAILIPLIFIAAACTQSAPATDPTVITSRSAEWDAALNAKDIDGVVALYTDDARMMAPNMEMGTGSDGVRAAFSGMIEAGLSVKLTSIDAIVAGDIGYNVGTYVLTAGDEQADVGKFVETWARGDDGVWRISNDIYNSDLAAAAAEPSMPMTHLVITHEVEDVDAWMAAWRGDDSRHKLFGDNGAAHVHTFSNPDNPNQTGLVIAVKDMDALTAMLGSEEGQAAAAEDGVKADTMTMLAEIE